MRATSPGLANPPLKAWMSWTLRIAGVYNIGAGMVMIVFYHECYRLLGIPKPELVLPIQLVGLLVAIFGIGYLMVDRAPMANRNVLLLGLLSKLSGPMLAAIYIVRGELPIAMLLVLFFADIIYLYPFWRILRWLGAAAHPSMV
jgi:hypothetical protein